jgi:hypothetical protein
LVGRSNKISDVKVDEESVGAVSSFRFTSVSDYHKITAFFDPESYTIITNAGTGGRINPAGEKNIVHGSEQKYNIIPDEGYKIADVIVDNVSVGPVSDYTFSSVSAEHEISAIFSPVYYNIISKAGEGGSISPNGTVSIRYGKDQNFFFQADYGYKVASLVVDNKPVDLLSDNYSFTSVCQDHTISVSFLKMKIYNIAVGKCQNGSVSPDNIINIFEGSDLTFFITPFPDFRIENVFIDSVPAGPVSEYTFRNISADHSVFALFSSTVEPEIYPNPFKSGFTINIRSPYDYKYEISLITIGYRTVYNNRDIPANTPITLTPEIRPGFYILNVYYKGEKVKSARLLKY